ncbi:serine hydrolase [Pedobacter sp. WC2423]|uniref:serine hydrolase n=1 Tax=Pedobacter sp. WC2423 TaxID=3234142 RepID=UPI0034665C4E
MTKQQSNDMTNRRILNWKRNIIVLSVFFETLFCSCILFAQDTSSFKVNDKLIIKKEFDQQINKMLVGAGIPGISVAIIDGGQIVYSNAYGYKRIKSQDLVDKNTLFEACSLSKSFVVYMANQMADEHKLDLDKPLYEYLKYPLLEHDKRYKLITARMVLGHASGLENWKEDHNPDSLEILADPGTEYIYSGEGYQYLAKVIESLRKESYEDYTEKMIIKPLNLERTYVAFNAEGTNPSNYAIGHDIFEKEVNKLKNTTPIPASGINLTAKDYAKLIISLFDEHRFSANRIKEMKNPVIKEHADNPSLFYGPGFEILRTDKDTLMLHGGDNFGFKGFVCYSITHKRGLVFLANSDRGKSLTKKLCEMTVGFDIDDYFKNDYKSQYPSTAIELLNTYLQQGEDQMTSRLMALIKKSDGKIGDKILNELGRQFIFHDNAIARKLLNENIKLYPKSAFAYYLLGHIDMMENDFRTAHKNLVMAKELNYTNDPVDPDIKVCEEKINLN